MSRDARLRRLEGITTPGAPAATELAAARERHSRRVVYHVCSRLAVSPTVEPDARAYVLEQLAALDEPELTDPAQERADIALLLAAGENTALAPKLLTLEEIEVEVARILRGDYEPPTVPLAPEPSRPPDALDRLREGGREGSFRSSPTYEARRDGSGRENPD